MRRFRFCQHTKEDGELCGSPAMRKKRYCYFHLEVVLRRRRLARMARERQLMAEAKRYDDSILGLKSYAMKILSYCSRANSWPSGTCIGEGRGVSSPPNDALDDSSA
jgi:hypothetical protein